MECNTDSVTRVVKSFGKFVVSFGAMSMNFREDCEIIMKCATP